jgi:molybdate transport system ATP-binding protein
MTVPRLTLDIAKAWPGFRLSVQLDVGAEIAVLFGPSGAGKTTTLSAIAGLTTPDTGEIALDGQTLFRRGRGRETINVPTRGRHIGYVFQGYALFPHLTALENVAYPLWRQRDSRPRSTALLERMHLAHLADRYPHELSGGQQQRVAIARALAVEPRVLLLDEPFSALDTAVREHLQRDLAALQAELGLAVIYVTHRLEDAFAMGHRLAVMDEGQVAQVGPIEEVFHHPASSGVAAIMGVRNLLQAAVVAATPEGLVLDWGGLRLEALPQPGAVGTAVTAYIAPEDIKLLYPDRPLAATVMRNRVKGRIVENRLSASFRLLRVALANDQEIEVRFPARAYSSLRLAPGEAVDLSLRREGLIVLQV